MPKQNAIYLQLPQIQAIQEVLEERGMSHRDLATVLRMDRGNLSNMFNGNKAFPSRYVRLVFEALREDQRLSFLVGEGYAALHRDYLAMKREKRIASAAAWEEAYMVRHDRLLRIYQREIIQGRLDVLEALDQLVEQYSRSPREE